MEIDNVKWRNVVDVIYHKYPCVKDAVDKAGVIMATTTTACELILRSPMWIQYVKESKTFETKKLWKRYGDQIKKFGVIVPDHALVLGQFNEIVVKAAKDERFSAQDKQIIISIAKGLGIKIRGLPRSQEQVINLLKKCQEIIDAKGFHVSATFMLYADWSIKTAFKDFLYEYLAQLCYISPTDLKMEKGYKEAIRLVAQSDVFYNTNIGEGYIQHIIDTNLAQSFPDLYAYDEKLEPNDELIPDAAVLWENRPLFPKYGMIWFLSKEDYLVTNFISAKTGYDTVQGTPDYDVYGQLICSNRLRRSGGMGKLLLVATILMAYQYKVNYIFIQAFQGITAVQGPLYNRMGFNFYFSNDLLKRKTAFNQWSLHEEPELSRYHKQYIEGTLDPKFLPSKLKHITSLQPMWLYVRGYEPRYACDSLEVSGFDYQTKKVGPMGSGVRKWVWDLPTRLLGIGQKSSPMETVDEEPSLEEKMSSARKPDKSRCSSDDECLSDFCVQGTCEQFPYNVHTTPDDIRIDSELKSKGFDIHADREYYQKRLEAVSELLDQAALEDMEKRDIELVAKEQDTLRSWYDLITLKQQDKKLSEDEKRDFDKRLQEYKKLTRHQKYGRIANHLLAGTRDLISNLLFGSKK